MQDFQGINKKLKKFILKKIWFLALVLIIGIVYIGTGIHSKKKSARKTTHKTEQKAKQTENSQTKTKEKAEENKSSGTNEQNAALKRAKTYATGLHMSKSKIYQQLKSKNAENFSEKDAKYAVDNLTDIDWKENALERAKTYRSKMNLSKNRIYQKLVSGDDEGFTEEEARYAIDNLPE